MALSICFIGYNIIALTTVIDEIWGNRDITTTKCDGARDEWSDEQAGFKQ